MTAKSVRNLIISLIILIIGVNILGYISQRYIPNIPNVQISGIASITSSFTTLISVGIFIIVLILIPVYLSKRSGEKKEQII